MTDKDWAEMMNRSPQTACKMLIDEYGDLVYAIVINKLKGTADRETIDDCVSDIFVEILRNTDKFLLSRGTLKGFISSIAKNTAIDTFRSLTYRRSVTVSADSEDVVLPPASDRTDDEIEDKLFRRHLWDIVKSLGEPDTTIITCQFFYDMTLQNIADKLKMSYAAVQKRSFRARERIKKILLSENYF
ncbi:MAG: sigma-70 family RNA polymerase sigma factor [Ruminococcus sp.]|nr:sigma-70 family RNA polymerase sigma factor [Ruminococcus sp.]